MAVYTPLNQKDIESFLARYDIGTLSSFEPITEGVSNTNYLLEIAPPLRGSGREQAHGRSVRAVGGVSSLPPTDSPAGEALGSSTPPQGGSHIKYILTLFEKRYRIEDLPYFAALMEWWGKRGISCPEPIKMKDGHALTAIKEKPAMLASFLEGSGVHKITLEHLAQLGKLVADMHIAGMNFPHSRENQLSLSGWEALIDTIGPRADEIDYGLHRLISHEYNFLSEHWPSGLPSGPIHADLFPDNVFFNKIFGKPPELSGVIDFYFACNDFWAYDLAVCVNAWCFDERHRFVPERTQALMHAYTDARPLAPEEEAALPLLLRGAALRFLLTRTYDWLNPESGAVVAAKDPMEYVKKLTFFQNFSYEKTR